MSAQPEEQNYVKVPLQLFRLSTFERAAALDVWAALQFDLRIDSCTRRVTDRDLMASLSLCDRSVEHARKGLEVLEREGFIVRQAKGSSRLVKKTIRFKTAVLAPDRAQYAAYLASPEWREKRQYAIERAGGRCQICNARGRSDVHHRTYERLGNELPEDLIVLCRHCHKIFHDAGKLGVPIQKEVG